MLPLLAMGALGAGGGLLSSLFGGHQPQQQTTTDPQLAAYLQQLRGSGVGMQGYLQALQAMQGLSGQNPQAAQQAMNPYMSAMNPYFDMLRQNAVTGANQQATMAHAFGGTGSQNAAAIAGSQADQQRSMFNYQGFQDAMTRLLQSGNLGLGLLQPNLQSATQQTTIPMQNNLFGSILGGGMAGLGFGQQMGAK